MGKSVVIVNTSAGAMGGNPTGLWLSELADPYYALKEAGLDVTIASIAGGAIPIDPGSMGENFFGEKAKKFMHDAAAVGALTHSVKVDAAMADQFDCVYLAGGHGCCVDFVGPQASALKALVEAAYAAGKIVAADCHGPMGLLECTVGGAPLVKGLEVTAFTNIEEDQAGATEWVTASARIKLCGTASASGAPDNSSLSHFSAMTRPSWLGRAVRNQHRHAIEQASRRWRGGRRDDSARTRRKI